MKKYIVTVYDSRKCQLTTVKVKADNLGEVETLIKIGFDGWGQITAIIVTQ